MRYGGGGGVCRRGGGGGCCREEGVGQEGWVLKEGGCRRGEVILFRAFFEHCDARILYRLWLIGFIVHFHVCYFLEFRICLLYDARITV